MGLFDKTPEGVYYDPVVQRNVEAGENYRLLTEYMERKAIREAAKVEILGYRFDKPLCELCDRPVDSLAVAHYNLHTEVVVLRVEHHGVVGWPSMTREALELCKDKDALPPMSPPTMTTVR